MGFTPPPYPYDRLNALRDAAVQNFGSPIDCSIGTPCDAPPGEVLQVLGSSNTERGYPTSAGSVELRTSIANYVERTFKLAVDVDQVAACVGTKEFVASSAQYLHLKDPTKDTVLFPAVSYPTYAMGATLAGLRSQFVPVGADGRPDLTALKQEDLDRALLLWSNSPSNPTGALEDLGEVARWGRHHGIPVFSDECYAEFTWDGGPRSILEHGLEGVLAVHSISKRSNLAGVRCGFYTGDPEFVQFLKGVRQHAGLMVPGPVQAAVAVAYSDDDHVAAQRSVYLHRLQVLAQALSDAGIAANVPEGTFYLWVAVPERFADGWELAATLAATTGLIVSPGDLYGDAGAGFIRIAVVVPDDQVALVAERLASSSL
ncbi:MAG: aminotransferase class I/II-fold pyridoxal phosphate-dependent enzyme [Actinomycetes bacterium]